MLSGVCLPFPLTEAEIFKTKLRRIDTSALTLACLQVTPEETAYPTIIFFKAGGFNVIFLATFQSGKEIIIRIPLDASPGVIGSTVATLSFARHYLQIPCPSVFAWNDDSKNPVHFPYILMEKVTGECLGDLWYTQQPEDAMDLEEKMAALHALSGFYVTMTRRLDCFNAFGSIFFNDEAPSDDLSDSRSYTVKPLVYSQPTDKNENAIIWSATPSDDIRVIWRQAHETLWEAMQRKWAPEAVKESGRSWDDIRIESWDEAELAAADLLKLIETVEIPASLHTPCLVHWDFALRNVMYDRRRRKITSILDWDDVAILPAVLLPHFPEEFQSSAPHSRMAGDWSIISSQPNGRYNDHRSGLTELDVEISLQYSHLASSLRDADNARYKQLFMQQLRLFDFDPAHLPVHTECKLCLDSAVCNDVTDIHRLLLLGYVQWCKEREWLNAKVRDRGRR